MMRMATSMGGEGIFSRDHRPRPMSKSQGISPYLIFCFADIFFFLVSIGKFLIEAGNAEQFDGDNAQKQASAVRSRPLALPSSFH
jgi:hypothetical protein